MVKHVAMWKVESNDQKQKDLSKMKEALEGLKDKIPEILEIEVGLDYAQDEDVRSDIVLNSSIASRKDLEIYQNHPKHKKVVKFIRTISSEKRVVDFTL